MILFWEFNVILFHEHSQRQMPVHPLYCKFRCFFWWNYYYIIFRDRVYAILFWNSWSGKLLSIHFLIQSVKSQSEAGSHRCHLITQFCMYTQLCIEMSFHCLKAAKNINCTCTHLCEMDTNCQILPNIEPTQISKIYKWFHYFKDLTIIFMRHDKGQYQETHVLCHVESRGERHQDAVQSSVSTDVECHIVAVVHTGDHEAWCCV